MIVERESRESQVRIDLQPQPGASRIDTGIRFLDHMLVTLAACAGWRLEVQARGDLVHHIIEDVAITLGTAIREARPAAVARYAHRVIAMDDALVAATVDAGDRFWYEGPVPSSLYDHFLRSLAEHARLTLHVEVRRGRDRHHMVEAAFKAVGFALREALAPEPGVVSTKGAVRLSAGTGT